MKRLLADRQRLLPLLLTLVCLLLPTAASANGAMSLALTTFAWEPWLAYVVVTIVFEAAALGKWLHIPFARALKYSLGANFLTAVLGGFLSGFICALLGFYGGRLNPNPFGQALLLFTLFGSLSALIEAYVWREALLTARGKESRPEGAAPVRTMNVIGRCLAVHLVGVPLGMAVLLVPSRPYPGLESQVYSARLDYLERDEVKKSLQDYINAHKSLPPVHSYGELLQLLKPNLGHFANDPDLWAAAYLPEYHRFDVTERKRQRIEWNDRAAGVKVFDGTENTLWLLRSRYHGQSPLHSLFSEGLVLEPGGWIKRATDPKKLGYDT